MPSVEPCSSWVVGTPVASLILRRGLRMRLLCDLGLLTCVCVLTKSRSDWSSRKGLVSAPEVGIKWVISTTLSLSLSLLPRIPDVRAQYDVNVTVRQHLYRIISCAAGTHPLLLTTCFLLSPIWLPTPIPLSHVLLLMPLSSSSPIPCNWLRLY